ncbi:ABC transporter permease [Leuconostoc mesenteroides]|uniref:ABC transporter permease n=1 Tax=Leuconostoc mesenteroides TaxID=1245 RepID=UPI001CBB0CFA|nr:ABC transporter permease [Leuconostoc mesenteroides]MBZ1516637.1 ABC transporter permease [Leuconostoc mesenteroides]MBZ1540684.1 ABC transporter permease [Leuconostoc mesenteroides]
MAANTEDFVIVGAQSSDANEHISKPALSFWQDAWRRLKLNKLAVVSMWFLVFILGFAIISNVFVKQSDANSFDSDNVGKHKNLPPKSGLPIPGWNGKIKSPGSTEATDSYSDNNVKQNYLFGTDNIGRSLGKRVIVGMRISLLVAISATVIDLVIGVTYGVISGWKGGWVDVVMQRIIEILSSVPNLIVVTMFGLLLGNGVTSIIIAIAITGWLSMARQVRNMTLSLKERDYILAAKSLGESSTKIAIKHLIPNMAGTIIVQIMMTVPSAIMFEAILSAINLGVKPPTASLGSLISDAQSMLQFYPYQVLIPSGMLVLISLAFILLGDGLRDAFDPRASED